MMADEIKTEMHMRWDARTNMILGICWEHGNTYGLEFKSMAQAFALQDGIANNEVHLATGVSCLHYFLPTKRTHCIQGNCTGSQCVLR